MLLFILLFIPLLGIFIIYNQESAFDPSSNNISFHFPFPFRSQFPFRSKINNKQCNLMTLKYISLIPFLINLFICLTLFILFDFDQNEYQFVQEYYKLGFFEFYLGIDGLSIYFILLTSIIMPIALLSNWVSVIELKSNRNSYVAIMLLLEVLLYSVFLVLDVLSFYIFFESILPPLFLLIGMFGSNDKTRASFYIFLYTLIGSLFLLLSILTIWSVMGTTDFNALCKTNFNYVTQLFIFSGIIIAFAVKTPTIFLNNWLLKAHVESPLGGSIILAGVVLKLSLYGILRIILPLFTQATFTFIYVIYLLGVITIFYASVSTLRTIDVKELIAYSSVCHAAVYLLGVFSNSIIGIEGSIVLGLAHGFVSSGLFICVGGVLYDRSSTRLISFYRGITQIMPIFSIMFFILSLANCGVPLSLNFIGEFMSLYGVFERLPFLGVFASFSIVLSACYTILMYNRISFGGAFFKIFLFNIPDVNKREFVILLPLVIITIFFGVYPTPILDGLSYQVSGLIYSNFF